MAANTDNTQINSFYKGMNSDLSYSMIQDGQYVRGENVRVTGLNQVGEANLTNGVGEIRPIEGVKVEESNLQPLKILATGSIRDTGVIVYQAAEDNTWKVAVFRNGDVANITTIFESEEEPQVDKFSIVLHHEIEGIEKLYIADGINPIKLILIQEEDGEWKHVLKDEVESYPKVIFQPIKFEGLVEGQLKSGMVQYAYRLYKKYSIATDISPTTNLIPIINNDTHDGYREGYKSNSGVKLSFKISTDYNFLDRILIYRIFYQENGQLPIISIIYDDKKDDLLDKDTTDIYHYDDLGDQELDIISLEEFNSLSGIHIIPKVIENKNDYLFAALIKDCQSDVFDVSNVKGLYKLVDVTLIGDASDNNSSNTSGSGTFTNENGNFGGSSVNSGSSGSIYGGSRSGSGSGGGLGGRRAPRNDNGIYQLRHNTIKRETDIDDWEFNIRYDEDYSEVNNADFTQRIEELKSNPTYKNPKVSYYLKSLRRGETYRFGIVFFDEYGNSSGVIKLGEDVTIPDFNESPTFEFGNAYELIVHPIGIEWTITGIPKNAVAYEIVRCRRKEENIKNLSQGVLSRPIKRYKYQQGNSELDSNFPYTPTGFLTMQDFAYGTNSFIFGEALTAADRILQYTLLNIEKTIEGIHADNYDNKTLFLFVSPEAVYTPDLLLQEKKGLDLYLNFQELLYSNPGNLNAGGTFGGNYELNSSRLNYYASTNNTMLFTYPYSKTFSGGSALDSDDGHYKLCVDYTAYALQFYKIHGDGIVFDKNTDVPFSFVPPTQDVIQGTSSLWHGDLIDAAVLLPTEDKSVKNIKRLAYSYIKLYNSMPLDSSKIKTINGEEFPNRVKLSNLGKSNDLLWNQVFEYDNDNVTNVYEDYAQIVGQHMYNNIVIGGWYGEDIKGIYRTDKNEVDNEKDNLFIANGGRCALISTDQEIPTFIPNETYYWQYPYFMYTTLCSVQKDPQPYGDDKFSTYYSYGDYHLVNGNNQDTVISFIGDTFIEPFEYISMHKIYWPTAWDTIASHMVGYSIPVETSINLAYTCGQELSKTYKTNSAITNLQVEPANVYNVYSQEDPLYVYNNAYSVDTTAKIYASNELLNEDSSQKDIDYRVYHSNLKLNGEYIDNWLKYQPANYIDVESKYGEITHLRNFHNKLLFWQEQATGLLSVNERVQISDDNNLPLILGTGGVLDRYDYLDDTAGMKKEQYCDTMSDTTLYWYDDDNNEIRAYADGSGIVQLNKVYGTLNLMHEYDDDNTPWMFYDKKYNEAVLDLSNNPKWSIAYNEQVKAFTSLYNVGFDGAITFKDGIYLLNTNPVQKVTTKTVTKTISYDEENQVVENVVEEIPITTTIKPTDLGLSVKWADRYLYAPDDKSYGTYVGWGDITGELKVEGYQNYGPQFATNISGDPKYDIATYVLGDGWRLPTKAEYNELVTAQNLTWTYNADELIYTVTADNGNKMLLPASSSRNYQGILPDGWASDRQTCHFWLGDSKSALMANSAHISLILNKRNWAYEGFADKSQHKLIRPVFDGEYTQQYTTVVKPVTNTQKVTRTETVEEVVDVVEGANLQLGKWNEGDVTNFDGKIKSRLQYVVNKNPLTTKVFDNQEIISDYHDNLWTDHSYFTSLHKYNFKSDLNESDDVYHLMMTTREGNYRYAVPRAKYQTWGNRIRGKYMLCTIESAAPEVEASIKYIITKFRTSWS